MLANLVACRLSCRLILWPLAKCSKDTKSFNDFHQTLLTLNGFESMYSTNKFNLFFAVFWIHKNNKRFRITESPTAHIRCPRNEF
jgi:hypothetical protein